jgi:hypothetical protein
VEPSHLDSPDHLWSSERFERRLMKLPDTLTIRAKGTPGTDVSGIIFELTVVSGTKNRYYIILPKTDSGGIACLTSQQFRGQFEDHWEAGVMDYNGTVDTAIPTVTVRLLEKNRIEQNLHVLRAWPLLKNERKWWNSREEKLQYWLSCRNDRMSMQPTSWQIENSFDIELEVRARG